MIDVVTQMQFDAGELTEVEIVEMLSEMLEVQGLDGLDSKFAKMALKYLHSGILDEEGNVNYILLNRLTA